MENISNIELYDKIKRLEDKIELLLIDKNYSEITILDDSENFHKSIVDAMLENFMVEAFTGLNSSGKPSSYYKFLKRIKENESFIEKVKVLYLKRLKEDRHYDSYLTLIIDTLYDATTKKEYDELRKEVINKQISIPDYSI